MILLSIILPVHNEEKEIENVIKKLYIELKKIPGNFEVLCIENGSTDNTLSVLKNLGKRYHNLYILTSQKGWGNAVQKGIKESKGKYICYMVSDGQIDPSYIPHLYNIIQKSTIGMVKVYRVNRENNTRLITSKFYNLVANILFGIHSKDINATPKIMLASHIKGANFVSENIAFDLELFLYIKKKKISWKEIPAHSKKRQTGTSTTNIKSVFEMLSYIKNFYVSKTNH